MGKDTNLVYFQVIDGSEKEIQTLSKELGKIKDKVNMEFLVGNERIELHDVKFLINSLYELYKQMKDNGKQAKKK